MYNFFIAEKATQRVLMYSLVMSFFADFLDKLIGLGVLFKLFILMIFTVCYLPHAISAVRAAKWISACILAYLIFCFVLFSSFFASFYEFMRIALTLVLVCGSIKSSFTSPKASMGLHQLETLLRRALGYAIAINAVAVLLQMLFGDNFIALLGVPLGVFHGPQTEGRFSGLIINLPLWSSMLFVRILLSDYLIFKTEYWPLGKLSRLAVYAMLVLSGQKFVIILTLIHFLISDVKFNKIIWKSGILATVVMLGFVLDVGGNAQVLDKGQQLEWVTDVGILNLGKETDSLQEYPQFPQIDMRVNSWLYSVSHIRKFPLGKGLGTWGDYSASLNPEIIDPVIISESQWAHILVEQGYLAFVAIFVISCPFLFANKKLKTKLKWLGFYLFIAGWFTMGSSDYLWFYMMYILMFNLKSLASGDLLVEKVAFQ